MKINKPIGKKISNDTISDIPPIKEGASISNSNTKSIFKFKKEEDDLESDLYSNKNEDKDDLLSLSSEDIDAKINRLINIKKKSNSRRKNSIVESKKELDSVNKLLRTSMQKKNTKKFMQPIISPNSVISNQNNITNVGNNRREETKEKTNEEKIIYEKNIKKIESKTKKLELLKRRKKEYLDLIQLQIKRREEEMKSIEEKINKQNIKYSKLYDGESISNTESVISELNPNMHIENGIELLMFVFKNNLTFKKLNFFETLVNLFKNRKEGSKHQTGRTEKKRKTQKLILKKSTFRERDKKSGKKRKKKKKEKKSRS